MMRYDRLLQIPVFLPFINGKGNTAVEIRLTYLRELSSKFALPVVIFIFHKMNEVMEHADRDMDRIVRTPQKGKSELMLEAKELRVKNDMGLIALHDIIFIFNVRGYLYR